jgi:hypothetical protein
VFPYNFLQQYDMLLVIYRAFSYSNGSMNILEKFYADARRRIEKLSDSAFRQELSSFFVQTIRNYDKSLLPLAEDAAAYWLQAHIHDTKEKAADWFYTVFSLFDGSFGSDMDFSDEDWEELHAIISAAAESLDMHTVSTIMSVMVERHKLE